MIKVKLPLGSRTDSNYPLLLVLISFGTSLLLPFVLGCYYRTNDDLAMMMWTQGIGLAESPSSFTIFTHIFYGNLLVLLSSVFSTINWHFWLLYAGSSASVHLALEDILETEGSNAARFAYILLSLSIMILTGLFFNFTSSALLLSISGARLAVGTSLRKVTWGLTFIVFSFLVRPSAAYLGLAALMFGLLETYGSPKRNGLSRFIPIALLVGVFLSGNFLNNAIYKSSGWGNFFEFNALRANINDYSKITATPELLSKSGLSLNDYQMIKSWNFADKSVFSLDALRALNESTGAAHLEANRIENLKPYGNVFYISLATLSIFLATIFGGSVRAAAYSILFAAMFLGIGIFLKMPDRIADVLILGPIIMLASSTQIERWRNVLLATTVVFSAFIFQHFLEIRSQKISTQSGYFQALDEIRSNEAQLVVMWGTALPLEAANPLKNLADFHKLNLFGLGVTSQSQFNDAWMSKYAFDDIYRYSLANPQVIWIAAQTDLPLLQTYYREHYKVEVLFTPVGNGLFKITDSGL